MFGIIENFYGLKIMILWRYKKKKKQRQMQPRIATICDLKEQAGSQPGKSWFVRQGDMVKLCQAGSGKAILISWKVKRLHKHRSKEDEWCNNSLT